MQGDTLRIVSGVSPTSPCPGPVERLQAGLGDVHMCRIRKLASIVFVPNVGLIKSRKKEN